jgi:hypothetical protein
VLRCGLALLVALQRGLAAPVIDLAQLMSAGATSKQLVLMEVSASHESWAGGGVSGALHR